MGRVERLQAHRVEAEFLEVTSQAIGGRVIGETRNTREVDTEEAQPCPAIVDEMPELSAHETVRAGCLWIQRGQIGDRSLVVEPASRDLEKLDLRS
ncbi:MAG TPA: hypothetical protein VNW92_21565 [Polyangiaceae bacterium]|jgi:hypothetical protein|nr:hypothetical protein [Polyangiaceae bacterium]